MATTAEKLAAWRAARIALAQARAAVRQAQRDLLLAEVRFKAAEADLDA